MDSNQLADFDNFFYYGSGDLEDEIASDLLQLLVQPKRSLYYSRSRNSAGIPENYPNSSRYKFLVPYDAISAISKRNNTVGNGQSGTKERRVATSQNMVLVEQKSSLVNISLFYIPFTNVNIKTKVGFQVGLNNRG